MANLDSGLEKCCGNAEIVQCAECRAKVPAEDAIRMKNGRYYCNTPDTRCVAMYLEAEEGS